MTLHIVVCQCQSSVCKESLCILEGHLCSVTSLDETRGLQTFAGLLCPSVVAPSPLPPPAASLGRVSSAWTVLQRVHSAGWYVTPRLICPHSHSLPHPPPPLPGAPDKRSWALLCPVQITRCAARQGTGNNNADEAVRWRVNERLSE